MKQCFRVAKFQPLKPYHKMHMFNIVQPLVPNWYFVVLVAHNLVVRHKELEQHTAGTKFKFTITIFKFSSISFFFFSNFCSLLVVGFEIGVVENHYYY